MYRMFWIHKTTEKQNFLRKMGSWGSDSVCERCGRTRICIRDTLERKGMIAKTDRNAGENYLCVSVLTCRKLYQRQQLSLRASTVTLPRLMMRRIEGTVNIWTLCNYNKYISEVKCQGS